MSTTAAISLADQIENLLPQTQCTKCGYPACRPYAEAIADGNTNYNPASGSVDIIINKVNAVITVNGFTGSYDGNAHGASGTAFGVESTPADLSSLLHLGDSFTDVPGGTANWTFDGNGNYNSASGSVPKGKQLRAPQARP